MKVLVLHNRYRDAGGEDVAVDNEIRMLSDRGVEVAFLEAVNPSDPALGLRDRVGVALRAGWSEHWYSRVLATCREVRPDVAHVHNFWMELSPSVHAACHDAGVPTVQSLHNFRLLCANALLLRDGHVCEDCLGKFPWRGVTRRCYRNSFLASAAVANMIQVNRRRGTWNCEVDAFITPSEHSRSKFIAGGLPAERIFTKPNVVEDCGRSPLRPSGSDTLLYVGRLSKEKGLDSLLVAWAEARLRGRARLLIVGDGPAEPSLRQLAHSLGLGPPELAFIGKAGPDAVRRLICESRAVVAPSICFETFGNTVVEAFCAARPALVSNIGALGENVEHERTGLKFQPGDVPGLAEALSRIVADSDLADRLGENARKEYSSRFATDRNYELLMGIYRFAIGQKIEAVAPAAA